MTTTFSSSFFKKLIGLQNFKIIIIFFFEFVSQKQFVLFYEKNIFDLLKLFILSTLKLILRLCVFLIEKRAPKSSKV